MNDFDKLIIDAVGIGFDYVLLLCGIALGLYWFLKK